jgi:hypothetical protein
VTNGAIGRLALLLAMHSLSSRSMGMMRHPCGWTNSDIPKKFRIGKDATTGLRAWQQG